VFYDRETYRIEEVENLEELRKVIPKAYPHPAIRRIRMLSFMAVENIEIYDFYTKTFLGSWDDYDSFDFAGASDAVIDTLDAHFRLHFSLRRKTK
jgi:hypothetical protein